MSGIIELIAIVFILFTPIKKTNQAIQSEQEKQFDGIDHCITEPFYSTKEYSRIKYE